MTDITGTAVTIQMKIEYSDGGEKTITIPKCDAARIGALIFDQNVFDDISKNKYDSQFQQGFAETVTGPDLSQSGSGTLKSYKHTMAVIYTDESEAKFTCSAFSHPKTWE